MNIRRFPAAVFATGTLTMWLYSTAVVVSQEISSPKAAPEIAAVPAVEAVQLSSGAADVLKLSRAKLNDDVTVAFIQNGDRYFALTASEIVYLRKEGVSDRVLAAMLNQKPEFAPAPELAAPAPAPTASAPQYTALPATTTFAETVPASTTYVIPSTPSYYSFYDPWPYWYEPWPYWYTSAYWSYPFFTFGFYWGNCNYGYWNQCYFDNGHWNNCWHDGNQHSPSQRGNHAAALRDGRSVPGDKTGMQASKGSPSDGVRQAGLRSGPGPSARAAQSADRASLSSDSRSQTVVPRSGASPTSIRGSGANSRTTSRDSIGNPGGTQITHNNQPVAPRSSTSQTRVSPTRGGQVAGPTKVWTGVAGQAPTSRSVMSQRAPSVTGSSRVSASPTTVWNRSASQPVSRPAVSPAASYQRSNFSPAYSSRSSGSVGSIGHPSMSSSYGNRGSTSAFRGGGSFAGSSAPRMSSGGGGSRGGGGGGFASGGFSKGGGGGGGGSRR